MIGAGGDAMVRLSFVEFVCVVAIVVAVVGLSPDDRHARTAADAGVLALALAQTLPAAPGADPLPVTAFPASTGSDRGSER